MKHKHYDCIVAWADGAQIQYFYHGEWVDWESYTSPSWGKTIEYRIAPKPDVVVFVPAGDSRLYRSKQRDGDNLRLTFDGKTGELKSAEVLK
jgi:hypothetical protein